MDDAAIRVRICPRRKADPNRVSIDCERVEQELWQRGVTMTPLRNERCASATAAGARSSTR